MLIFDNLSSLSPDMSDAICRLSSGIDSGIRKLFTDATQFGVRGSRSILFTAVKNPVTAPDLAERQVILKVPAVKDEQRITNRQFWLAFEQDAPMIFGALYDYRRPRAAGVATRPADTTAAPSRIRRRRRCLRGRPQAR